MKTNSSKIQSRIRKNTSLLAMLAALLTTVTAIAPAQAADQAFTCAAQFYQISTTGNALYSTSIISSGANAGKLQYTKVGNGGSVGINGIGYNPADNLIYGVGGITGGTALMKIDAAGVITQVGSKLAFPSGSPGSGDFIAPNKLLVIGTATSGAADAYYLIDVPTQGVTKVKNNGPDAYPTGAGDFAFSNGIGYGMAANKVYKIDATHATDASNPYVTINAYTTAADTSAVSPNTSISATSKGWGAAYLDRSGNAFFFDNDTHNVVEITATSIAAGTYKTQLVGGGAAVIPAAGLAAPNDGASCPNAPSPYDPPTPADDTYTTVWDTTLTAGTSYSGGAFTTASTGSFAKLLANDSWNSTGFLMDKWRSNSSGTAAAVSGASITSSTSSLPGTADSFTVSDGTFRFTPTNIGSGSFQYNLIEPAAPYSPATHTYATVAVNVLGIGSISAPSASLNSPYSYQVPTVGTGSGYAYSMSGCAPGLSISSTGQITGTPTSAAGAPYTCVITLTVNGKSVSKNLTLAFSTSYYTLTYDVNSNKPANTSPNAISGFTQDSTHSSTTLATPSALTGYTFAGWNTAVDGSGSIYNAGATFTPVANTTLYARWTPVTSTIIWNANGGSGAPANQSYSYPNLVTTLPAGPTPPTGYSFTHWYTSAACSTLVSTSDQGIFTNPSPITYYACYSPISYNVVYDVNTGDAWGSNPADPHSTFTVASGYKITTTVPTKTGSTFLGWYTAATGGTLVAADSPWSTPGNVTFYAHWGSISTYAVGYDANGGSGAPAGSTAAAGTPITIATLTGVTRAGYNLVGWNTKADGTGAYWSPGDIYTMTSANVTFYATWVPISYVITYDGNGGTGTETNTVFTIAQAATINNNAFTRNGYTFAGWWNTNRGNTGTTYSPGDTYDAPTNLQLFAVWTPNQYNITYNNNGATTTTSGPASSTGNVTTFAYGTGPVILGAGSWARTNTRFGGWNTASNGSGYSFNEGDAYTNAANLTLYAQWIPLGTYVVTYDPNGGTGGPANQTFVEGGSVVIQGIAPTRAGYDFAGWWNSSSNGAGATYAPGDRYSTLASLTLFAQWIPHSWDVAYDENGGMGNAPAQQHFTVPYSVTLSDIGAVSRPGYTFDGWNTKDDGTGQDYAAGDTYGEDGDLLLYAVWTPIEYMVTYDANGATSGTTPGAETFTVESIANIDGNTNNLVKSSGGNWTFAGWNTKADGTGTSFSANSFYDQPADLDLYAIWIPPATYAVTYDSNGGSLASGQVGTQQFTTSVTIQNGTPTRAGYSFNGWNTAKNGSGEAYVNPDVYSTAANLTLFADWVLDTYLVIYDANGGTGSVATQQFDVEHPDVINSTTGLSRSGYTIAGWWNSTSTATGSTYAPGDRFKQPANLTLYAIWVPNNYEITYDMNGGTGAAPASQSFTVETPAVIESGHSFSKANQKFVGWSTESTTAVNVFAPGDHFAAPRNLLLFAIWENLDQFTVTYDMNGLNSVTAPQSETFSAGSSVVIASAPQASSSTGYVFAGWNTQPDGSGDSYAAGVDTYRREADMLLYAIWTAVEYKVLYIANNGVGTTPTPTTFDVEHPATIKDLTGATLNRPGFTFVGWNTHADGSGDTYAAGDHYSTGGGDLHLYAIWDTEHYTLSYDLNEGDTTTVVASQNFTVETPTAISATTPTRAGGYTFRGWNSKADGTGIEYQAGDLYYAPHDSIIYAQWVGSTQYEVDFNTHGGTPSPLHMFFPKTGSPWFTFPSPASINRAGFTLAHVAWCTAASGGTCTSAETATVNANITYHLQWVPNTVHVTYNFNAGGQNVLQDLDHTAPGVLPNQQTFTYSDTSTAAGTSISVTSSAFWRPGYSFDGWNTSPDGSGENFTAGDKYRDSADITLYAIWTLEHYRIEYDANGGDGTPPATVEFDVEHPGLVSYPSNLSFAWQVFQGWNTNIAGNAQAYVPGVNTPISYGAAANLFLFAQWGGKRNYTINYDANGGTGSAPGPFTFNIDNLSGDTTTITIRDVSTIFTRTGYNFVGLNTAVDGSGTTWEVGDLYTDPADVTFYAIWQCATNCNTGGSSPAPSSPIATVWHVSYFANGGSGSAPVSADINDGGLYTVQSGSGLTRNGYIFAGWNTSADGTGNSYAIGNTYNVASNVTLYAVWSAVATGGGNTGSGTPSTPSKPTTPSTPTGNGGSNISSGTLTRHVTEKKVMPNAIASISQTVSVETGNGKVQDVLVNGKMITVSTADPANIALPTLVGPKDKVVVEVKQADGTIEEVKIAPSADPVQIANVNFDLAAYYLTASAKKILDEVIAVVKQHGFTTINLVGHTDSLGSTTGYNNDALSFSRAKTVKAYLAAHLPKGIVILASARAHVDPVASNQTKAGQAANRRVEIDVK